MPSNHPLISRRQCMGLLATSAALPFATLQAAAAKSIRGAFMILSTPYTHDDKVDYEDLGNQVDFLDLCGVQGLVWPQNSSEQLYLSKEERLQGFDVLAAAARGRPQVLILGVQADDIQGMLDYARHAEQLAPDGMIAIPPTTANSLTEIRDYYAALCDITERPIFVQTSGGPDLELTTEFLAQLARDFPQCAYIKEEYGPVQERMLALKEYRPDPIKSIFGASFGVGWLYEMRLEMDGVMTGGTMYADVYAALWQLHLENRQEELRDCYSKLLLMLNLDSLIPGVRLYVLQKRGVFKTTKSRRADYSFTDQQIAEIDFRLDSLRPYLKV